jgi:hypothetical protein
MALIHSRLFEIDVLPLRVQHKLGHWPNVAHAFIHRLTNQKPLFCHSQSWLLGQSGH